MNATRIGTVRRLAIGLMGLTLIGCGMSNHQRHVNAANERWRSMRSTLVLQMALQQFEAGDLEQAGKTLAEAMQIDATNPRLFTLAGRVALERGQLERSYHRFRTAIELDPLHAEAHYFQGIVLQRWAQFDGALISYRKAYEIEADNASYLLATSEMLVMLDRTDDAMQMLTEKMAYFDMNAGMRVAIGQLYAMRGDYVEAVRYFRQAGLIRPDDQQIEEELALALLKAGQGHEAVQRLEQLCQMPSLAHRRDLVRSLGESYVAVGRTDEAKRLFIQMTRTNPMDADAWLKLGELALVQRDAAGATLAATRFKKLAPKRHEGYVLAGVVFSHKGDVQQALNNFDRAAELAPEEPEPLLLRGIALERDGRLADAAQAYSEALRRDPSDRRAGQLLDRVSSEVEQSVLTGD